jgi:hypothetical protein
MHSIVGTPVLKFFLEPLPDLKTAIAADGHVAFIE